MTQLRLARERAAAKPGPRVSQEMLVTIAGVTLLVLAVGAWWAVKPLFDAARPNAARPVAVRAPAAPSAPAVPSARAAPEAQPAADVLHALQGLRALVQGRGSYVEYGPRAFDVKKAVDRYVNTPGGDAELKRGARETMDLYMLAATAWNAALRANAGDEQGAASAFVSVSRDPALDFCPAAREARDNAKADATVPLDVVQGMGVVSAVPAIFACAESRLAEVERRMTGR